MRVSFHNRFNRFSDGVYAAAPALPGSTIVHRCRHLQFSCRARLPQRGCCPHYGRRRPALYNSLLEEEDCGLAMCFRVFSCLVGKACCRSGSHDVYRSAPVRPGMRHYDYRRVPVHISTSWLNFNRLRVHASHWPVIATISPYPRGVASTFTMSHGCCHGSVAGKHYIPPTRGWHFPHPHLFLRRCPSCM